MKCQGRERFPGAIASDQLTRERGTEAWFTEVINSATAAAATPFFFPVWSVQVLRAYLFYTGNVAAGATPAFFSMGVVQRGSGQVGDADRLVANVRTRQRVQRGWVQELPIRDFAITSTGRESNVLLGITDARQPEAATYTFSGGTNSGNVKIVLVTGATEERSNMYPQTPPTTSTSSTTSCSSTLSSVSSSSTCSSTVSSVSTVSSSSTCSSTVSTLSCSSSCSTCSSTVSTAVAG